MPNTEANLTEAQINKLAKRHFDLPHLRVYNNDQQDFSDQAVWNLEAALKAAFKLGVEAAKK
jgi:hypothetical protein